MFIPQIFSTNKSIVYPNPLKLRTKHSFILFNKQKTWVCISCISYNDYLDLLSRNRLSSINFTMIHRAAYQFTVSTRHKRQVNDNLSRPALQVVFTFIVFLLFFFTFSIYYLYIILCICHECILRLCKNYVILLNVNTSINEVTLFHVVNYYTQLRSLS